MKITLKSVSAPAFSFTEDLPKIPASEYERRLSAIYTLAAADWVVVYADREHYANLTYLLNFDPRFEEALLVLGKEGRRVLVLGNEDMGYTSVLPVPVDLALCQTLSLGGQHRETAPSLKKVLADIGIHSGQKVSVIGWKYLETYESDAPEVPAFVPAFFVDTLRALVSPGGMLTDGTALMMHPEQGMRSKNNNADQIAVFEWAARNCSAAVFNILRNARPGMSEMQALNNMNFSGAPFSMHPIFVSGKGEINGLRSPSSRRITYGDAISTGMGYWGSLVCRAGMMLGEVDHSFFENVAEPYYRASATWFQTMRIGVVGRDVFKAVADAFAGSELHSSLNPGHLTSYDEWVHSPIREDSSEKVVSGMVFQSDIIPTPLKPGQLINCEDTVAIADASLRAEIRASYPEMWKRIGARREHMKTALGLRLSEDVLPLTDGTAYLPPFWLANDVVCTVDDQES